MAQANLNRQVEVNAAKYNEFQERFYNNGAVTEGRLNEHKVVSGLPREGQTLATFTESPGGVKGFFNTIGRFFRRVFSFGSAQADRNLKSISSDFHRLVAEIFNGEDNIPPAVLKAMGTHDKAGGKMRPLSSFRIKAVNDAIAGLNPPQDNNVGNAGADENNAVGLEGEHPEGINNENNQNNEVEEEEEKEVEKQDKVEEEHKEEVKVEEGDKKEEVKVEEKKEDVEGGQEKENEVDNKQKEIDDLKKKEELERVQKQKAEEERLAKLKKEVETHNGLALKQLENIEKDLLDGLNDAKEQQLRDIQKEIKDLKLNAEAEKAALDRMTKVIDDRLKGLPEQIKQKVADLKQKVNEATTNVKKFDDSNITLAGDLDQMLKECTGEIAKEKNGLTTLIKGFQDGTSETFKTFAKEYFNSKTLEDLVKNTFEGKGYNKQLEDLEKNTFDDKGYKLGKLSNKKKNKNLFDTNKNLFDTLKNDVLKGIGEGEIGKTFRKNAENWLAEVINGKTSGFNFAAPNGDKMETSGKQIADKVLQGFQAKEKKCLDGLEVAKRYILMVSGQIKTSLEKSAVNIDLSNSWLDPKDQTNILEGFNTAYSAVSKELADHVVLSDLFNEDDLKNGTLSLDETKTTIDDRLVFFNDGLANLEKSKKAAELGLQNFIENTGHYIQLLPEGKRKDFKDIVSAVIVDFPKSAFSTNEKRKNSAYTNMDEVCERLANAANSKLKEKGLPELSTQRTIHLARIFNGKATAQNIAEKFGSTPEKLGVWTLKDKKDNNLTFIALANHLNKTLDEEAMKVLGAPRDDDKDGQALSGIALRAIKVMEALKGVARMIDLYCGSVEEGGFKHEKMSLDDDNRGLLITALSKAITEIITGKAESDDADKPKSNDLSERHILEVFGKRISKDVAPNVTLHWGTVQKFELQEILNVVSPPPPPPPSEGKKA